jgi:hypothetical protein
LQIQIYEGPSDFAKRVVWDGFTIAEMTHDLYAQNIIPSLNFGFQLPGQVPIYCETALQTLEVALIYSEFEMAASSLREILANTAGGTFAHLTQEARTIMKQIVRVRVEIDPSSRAFYDRGCVPNIVVNHFKEDNTKASTAPAFAVYNVPSFVPTAAGTTILTKPMIDCIDILHLLISQACKQYLDWLGQDEQPEMYKATILLIKPPKGDCLAVNWRARYGQPKFTSQRRQLPTRHAFARLYTAQISHDWIRGIIHSHPLIARTDWKSFSFPLGLVAQSSQLLVLGPKPHGTSWNRDFEETWLPNLRLLGEHERETGFKKPWLPPSYGVDALDLILNATLCPCEDYLRPLYALRDRLEEDLFQGMDIFAAGVSSSEQGEKTEEASSEGTTPDPSDAGSPRVDEILKGMSPPYFLLIVITIVLIPKRLKNAKPNFLHRF